MDGQAGLRLCCLQTPEDRFSRIEAHINEHLQLYGLLTQNELAGPGGAVGYMSDCRYVSDCRSRGRKFDPSPVPYFRGD